MDIMTQAWMFCVVGMIVFFMILQGIWSSTGKKNKDKDKK
jgi:hypothetical protein